MVARAVVYASTGSTDSTTQQAPGDGGAPMAGGGGPGGAGSLAAALHGEYVVSDGNGRTEAGQQAAPPDQNSTS